MSGGQVSALPAVDIETVTSRQFADRIKAVGSEHPWTNGQVERMNRTLKEATVKRFYYDSHDQLRRHLAEFVAAYNFARRLKALRGLTPYEFICKAWAGQPERFTRNPLYQMPGLNI